MQHSEAGLVDLPVVHITGVCTPVDLLQSGTAEQPILHQQIQVDEVGIAGKGREALVGAVAVAGGPQRKDLPAGLAGLFQLVGEAVGRRA